MIFLFRAYTSSKIENVQNIHVLLLANEKDPVTLGTPPESGRMFRMNWQHVPIASTQSGSSNKLR